MVDSHTPVSEKLQVSLIFPLVALILGSMLMPGLYNRPFTMYKFRTMHFNDACFEDIETERLTRSNFKLKNDPRITRVGRLLRRSSLDELPQFINVLLGQMTLVGPRPEETKIVERFSASQRQRLAVKPGVTGPVQIDGRGDLTVGERIDLELDYIRTRSLVKDLLILIRTLPAVIRGLGAY